MGIWIGGWVDRWGDEWADRWINKQIKNIDWHLLIHVSHCYYHCAPIPPQVETTMLHLYL